MPSLKDLRKNPHSPLGACYRTIKYNRPAKTWDHDAREYTPGPDVEQAREQLLAAGYTPEQIESIPFHELRSRSDFTAIMRKRSHAERYDLLAEMEHRGRDAHSVKVMRSGSGYGVILYSTEVVRVERVDGVHVYTIRNGGYVTKATHAVIGAVTGFYTGSGKGMTWVGGQPIFDSSSVLVIDEHGVVRNTEERVGYAHIIESSRYSEELPSCYGWHVRYVRDGVAFSGSQHRRLAVGEDGWERVAGQLAMCENGLHACQEPEDVWGYVSSFSDGSLFIARTEHREVIRSGTVVRSRRWNGVKFERAPRERTVGNKFVSRERRALYRIRVTRRCSRAAILEEARRIEKELGIDTNLPKE